MRISCAEVPLTPTAGGGGAGAGCGGGTGAGVGVGLDMVFLALANLLLPTTRPTADRAAPALSNSSGNCRSCWMLRLKLVGSATLVKRLRFAFRVHSFGGMRTFTRNVWWQ
jgi:hypothetical protein